MIYIGIAPGNHGNIFMWLPNNIVFTSLHAEFIKDMFPCCLDKNWHKKTLPKRTQLPYTPLSFDDDEFSSIYQSSGLSHEKRKISDKDCSDDDHSTHSPVWNPSQLPSNWDGDEQRIEETLPSLPWHNPPWERKVLQCPGNIYGENQHPTKQLKELERQSR